MKTPFLIALLVGVMMLGPSIGPGEDAAATEHALPPNCDDPIVVFRKVYLNESLPELGSRLYDKIDYALELRDLTRHIRIAEAELDVQRERVRVYDKYFGRTSALFVTRQEARLDVLRTEERLKLLRQEKLLALRYRNDQVRYRQLLTAENAALVRVSE